MGYLSIYFALFVLMLVIIYYLIPKKARGILLLYASILFYLSFDIKYILFLLFTALSTFFCAKAIEKKKHRKTILFLCVSSNVLIWFVIKVLPWTLNIMTSLLSYAGFEFGEIYLSLIIPIGISYYTLQAIGYLVDVYKNKIHAEKSFWKYLLFLSYFPAIVQGPISRYNQLMPELLNSKKYSFDTMRNGLILILFGLVKKMVIADRIGIFVNYCFNSSADLTGMILYLGALCYSIQLYMDFSGCVNICRGVSKLFGIELIHNFNRPYLAKSIKDFWNRWHMSLSSWLKDYIYIPLGGNRKGTLRKAINILITFLISGIWHGAGFSFLFWGFLHAFYQIIGNALLKFRTKFKKLIGLKENSLSDNIYKMIITFNLVTFAWIFFRANSFLNGLEYIKNMFSSLSIWTLFDGSLYTHGVSQNYFILLFIHLAIILLIEHKFSKQENVINGIKDLHVIIRWFIYLILIFDVVLFGVYGSGYTLNSFMYGGF